MVKIEACLEVVTGAVRFGHHDMMHKKGHAGFVVFVFEPRPQPAKVGWERPAPHRSHARCRKGRCPGTPVQHKPEQCTDACRRQARVVLDVDRQRQLGNGMLDAGRVQRLTGKAVRAGTRHAPGKLRHGRSGRGVLPNRRRGLGAGVAHAEPGRVLFMVFSVVMVIIAWPKWYLTKKSKVFAATSGARASGTWYSGETSHPWFAGNVVTLVCALLCAAACSIARRLCTRL